MKDDIISDECEACKEFYKYIRKISNNNPTSIAAGVGSSHYVIEFCEQYGIALGDPISDCLLGVAPTLIQYVSKRVFIHPPERICEKVGAC